MVTSHFFFYKINILNSHRSSCSYMPYIMTLRISSRIFILPIAFSLRSYSLSPRQAVVKDVYIALGSNIGDQISAFATALEMLRSIGNVHATSYLYESSPMYFLDQPSFVNAACWLKTDRSPEDVLIALKMIETEIGRTATFRNGPRVIDLDIVMHDSIVVSTTNLCIPHPRLAEREFVLRPMCDINPHLPHPLLGKTMQELLDELAHSAKSESKYLPPSSHAPLKRVFPFGRNDDGNHRFIQLDNSVLICGIVNATPDSFSDGGQFGDSVTAAVEYAKHLLTKGGADMIDLGGESTRPGALAVPPDVEASRVVPVIEALRRDKALSSRVISVDTRSAYVAELAVLAGADIVNDVSAGKHDPSMIATVARLRVPFISMHMRGDPNNMMSKEHTTYAGDVAAEAAAELVEQLSMVEKGGVPRWMQYIDPGIGFAKTAVQNLELLQPEKLRRFRSLLTDRPMMIGVSRKRFIETIIVASRKKAGNVGDTTDSVMPTDRDYGTIGACCASILGGANILRVHNTKAVRDAVDVFTQLNRL